MEVGYAFDEKNHVHTWNGKRMHGVTSVLKMWGDPGALVNWAANQAVDAMLAGETPADARKAHLMKRDKAGERGTEVHKELENTINEWINCGVPSMMPGTIHGDVIAWMQDSGITPLKSEMPVYHIDEFYAGIADGLIERDGKKYILDFKTSGSIQTKAFVQCAAYSVAMKHMNPEEEIAGVVVVHIPRGSSFDAEKNVYWFYDIKAIEDMWMSIYRSYKTDYELQKLIKY